MFPYQLNRIWHKLTYSGLGIAPTVVQSEQELVNAIINTPGSIGYIDDTGLIHAWESPKTNSTETVSDLNDQVQDTAQNQVAENNNLNINTKGVVNVIKISF